MSLKVRQTDLSVVNLRARMPFKYGIASLTELPHLFVRLTLELDGQLQYGVAADSLPPKWFTKNPSQPFHDELNDMLAVIHSACKVAEEIQGAETIFELWQRVYEKQRRWGEVRGYPPLLWGLGVSLLERALIDAFCRATKDTFGQAVRGNALGIRLETIYPELDGMSPTDLLLLQPRTAIITRHTVGLSDPLTERDIAEGERLQDGLPQSLEACIDAYGLTHFKIKLCGDKERDLSRLRQLAEVIPGRTGPEYAFTLDGNEQYQSVQAFRDVWADFANDPAIASFMDQLLFVEQPFHRDVALQDDVRRTFEAWNDRPPIIIDESDDDVDRLATALKWGYAGTSHKNCKGVFKSIANACLLEHRRRREPDRGYLLSGEDLTNIGPVALLQDLAVLATLGIPHAERNGHHYFRGLSMFSDDLQAQMLEHHGDIYRRHEKGFATLNIKRGKLAISSGNDAPFGLGFDIDLSSMTPLSAWHTN